MGFLTGRPLRVIFKLGSDWSRSESSAFKLGSDWSTSESSVFGGGASGNFKRRRPESGACRRWPSGVSPVVYSDPVAGLVSSAVSPVVYWGCCLSPRYGLMLSAWTITGFDCLECWIWKSTSLSLLIIIHGPVHFLDSFNFSPLPTFGWLLRTNSPTS